jgi:hypothetical protein
MGKALTVIVGSQIAIIIITIKLKKIHRKIFGYGYYCSIKILPKFRVVGDTL